MSSKSNKEPIWKTVDHPDGSKSLVIFYHRLSSLDESFKHATEIKKIIKKYKKEDFVNLQISFRHLGIFIATQNFEETEQQKVRKDFDSADRLLSQEIKDYMSLHLTKS